MTFGGLNYNAGNRKTENVDLGGNCLLSLNGYHDEYINQLGFVYGARFDSFYGTEKKWVEMKKHVDRLSSDVVRALGLYQDVDHQIAQGYLSLSKNVAYIKRDMASAETDLK